VTFAWTAVEGAAMYGVEYTGPDRQFANPNGSTPDSVNGYGGAGGGFIAPGASVTLVVGTAVPAGSYQVRVAGLSATGEILGSFSSAVTVTLPPIAGSPVAAAAITSPPEGATLSRTEPTTFAWTTVEGAAMYGVEYTGPDRQFANPGGSEPDPVNGYGGAGGGVLISGTSVTVVLGDGVPAGRYQIRVIGIAPTGELLGRFSDALTIVVPGTGESPTSPYPAPPFCRESSCLED
jgi:hypothetical protein